RAVKIVTVSESSKKDIADCGGISAHKITNTGEAISKNFKIIEKREELESIRKKYNLPQKFILSVGSIEPRKNLTFLLSVYKKLKEKIQKPEHKLVLAGRKAWGRNSIFEKIKELKLEKDVLMTGHVSGNDLAGIYNLAGIFVYPSFYEGFGLPPLEAMACGTPVIASDIPALRETLGNAAIFAGPYDVNGFAGAVESLLNNSNLSESLKTKAIERSRVFSWEKTAKNTIEIYQSLQ
ncbi:MAG: glycosyltransferase family 1 protein, partial [Candidatus Omnitrophota bacterium]|nr:glycosyltransferase family 1 protein [Candidatus Omnitrophota bacterium]